MHRNSLSALVRTYTPTSEETVYKDIILAFIAAHKDCFERTLLIGHITASAWLLNKAETHALLMHHAKLNKWVQPGGHCDGNPDVSAVALKEAQEESGIQGIVLLEPAIFDIDIHHIPEFKGVPAHYHYDIRFLLKVVSDERVIQNKESKELKWFGKNEELPTQERSVVRLFEKWKKRA